MNESRKLTLLLSGLAVICALATVLKFVSYVVGSFMTLAFIGVTFLVNAYTLQQNKENKKAWFYTFVGLALISSGIYIVAKNVI